MTLAPAFPWLEPEPARPAARTGAETRQSLVITIGARHTVVSRAGSAGVICGLLRHGPVLLAVSQAAAASAQGRALARVVRTAADQVAERSGLAVLFGTEGPIVAAAGIASELAQIASGGGRIATAAQLHAVTERLAMKFVRERRGPVLAQTGGIEILLVGAAVTAGLLAQVGAAEIVAAAEGTADQ